MNKLPEFKLERYFGQWEFRVRYLFSSSDCESMSVAELLDLADDDGRRRWHDLRLGYTESQGHPAIGISLLLSEILERVAFPVVAAGGIGSGRDVAAALQAGASGVRVGTRFVAAMESGAHPRYVEALIATEAEDTVVTETFSLTWSGAPHRVLRSCIKAALQHEGDIVGRVTVNGEERPIRRFAGTEPSRTTTGAVEAMALYAGESVRHVRRIQPAAAIIQELQEDAERALEAEKSRT